MRESERDEGGGRRRGMREAEKDKGERKREMRKAERER